MSGSNGSGLVEKGFEIAMRGQADFVPIEVGVTPQEGGILLTFEPSPELKGLREANRRQADTIQHLTADRDKGIQGLRNESDRHFEERNEARRKLADVRVLVGDLVMTARNGYFDSFQQSTSLLVNAGLLGQLERLVADEAAQGEGRGAALPRSHAARLAELASELGDVQAECCRLTDVNGDLVVELERLREAAVCVIGNGKLYPLDVKHQEVWTAVPSYLLGDLERAVTREAKPEPTEADVINPKFNAACGDDDKAYIDYLWSEIHRLQAEGRAIDPGQIPIDKEWWAKFRGAMDTLAEKYKSRKCHSFDLYRALDAWDEVDEIYVPMADRPKPEPARESVNARLLKAAKAVDASSDNHLTAGNYGDDWTGVGDDALVELLDAINAAESAQGEERESEDEGAGVDAGCDPGQIIHDQADEINKLRTELVLMTAERDNLIRRMSDLIGNRQFLENEVERLAARNAALGQVSSAAQEFRSACEEMKNPHFFGSLIRREYKSLCHALDSLPTGKPTDSSQTADQADATIVSMSAELHEMRERLKELADLGRTVVDGWRDNGVRGKEYIERINALSEMLDSLPK